MNGNNLESVLKALADAMAKPLPNANELHKSWTQSPSPTTGLTAYDLEAPAKLLYPVLTPLRNSIPRVGGGTGTASNWRAITGINTTNISAGVSEGNRGAVIAHTMQEFTIGFKGVGLEDYVTFEADYAAQGFDDAKYRAVQGTLNSTMIQEEFQILGGNNSLALGTTPTPTLAAVAGGGSLTNTAYSVICVALSLEGATGKSVAGGIQAVVNRTNADGSTDTYGGGSAQKSAAATVTPAAGGTINATVAPVAGAFGYAWFWGAAGSEVLGAITTINSVAITAAATGTQTAASLPASDNSRNSLEFDGILTYVMNPASNAYIKVMPSGTVGVGTPLTSDGAGGIVEIDDALQWFWEKLRLSPDTIWVSSDVQRYIRKKILEAGATSAQRFVFDVQQGKLMGGTMALSYLNPFGMPAGQDYAQGSEIPIKLHPNMPAGTILFTTMTLPYKLSNVTNVLQIKTRREYYQTEWPLRTRRYEYGVYADEVLQNYFPAAFGAIVNIGKG